MYGYRMMDGYGYESGWGWVIMLVLTVLFVVAVFAILRAVRGHDRYGMHSRGVDAMDIVKERYAKGEIDKKQFEEIKKDLSK